MARGVTWKRATPKDVARVIHAVRKQRATHRCRFASFDARLVQGVSGTVRSWLRDLVAEHRGAVVDLAVAREERQAARRAVRVRKRGARARLWDAEEEVRISEGVLAALVEGRTRAERLHAQLQRMARVRQRRGRWASGVFDQLCAHPRVRAVAVSECAGGLTIYLDTVYMWGGVSRYEIGDFALECWPWGRFRTRCLRSTCPRDEHPYGYWGQVCFGGAAHELFEFLACGDYVAFVDLAVHMLEGGNTRHFNVQLSAWRKVS